MPGLEIRAVRSLRGRRLFVDVPFRIHRGDPGWVPPLRLTVYDRLSPRHPAMRHQEVALWLAYRHGRPVGRIGACIDSAFNEYQNVQLGLGRLLRQLRRPGRGRCAVRHGLLAGPRHGAPTSASVRPASPPTTSWACRSTGSTTPRPC